MLALLRSRLAVRLALLLLVVSLTPILGAAYLFSRAFEHSLRGERERREHLLAERTAALVEEHVERAHAKLRTVARLFEGEGASASRRERDDLVARLQELVDPPDVFLELQFFAGGVQPQVLAQARQREFDDVQQLQPDYFARNFANLQRNAAEPIVQTPLGGKEWRDSKLTTIEGYQTLMLSVPVARADAAGALVAYVDFAPLVPRLAALGSGGDALEVRDAAGTMLAAAGEVAGAATSYAWHDTEHGWAVLVRESDDEFVAALSSFRAHTWPWVALAAVLALATSLVLSARITRPIARLERAANELSRGNFAASAALDRPDEIGRLGAAFDRMAGALHELDRVKSEFVANVSHELRTPLTSLKLSVANLLDGVVGEVDPRQRAALRRVQGELERLIGLVNQLLEMARLEAGAVEPQRERVELEPLAREVVASLEPLAGEHAIAIEIEGAGAVRADRSMVQRVLLNLLDNAIKFSPARGTVRVVLAANGFRVQDQGPGVETSFTFEPFRQGQQHGVKNPGVGLGLAIVRKLVELNHGSVRVESGAGAGLVVELPRA